MKINLLLISLLLSVKVYSQIQITSFTHEQTDGIVADGFVEFNGMLFFSATTDGYGHEIWVSDGTSANTTLLKDINKGEGDGFSGILNAKSAILNNELYFFATDEEYGTELWKTDGTTDGTVRVTNSLDNDSYDALTAAGNYLFFLQKGDYLQVWKCDGTNEGTLLVKDNISFWNSISFQGKCNDKFIFTFQANGSNDAKVWCSDGTTDGTHAITDALDGNGSYPSGTSGLTQYINYNDKLYFISRYYLHETDGTAAGTKIISDVWDAGSDLLRFSDAIEVGGKMYFMFYSADLYQLSIWESDGTTNGTKEIYTNNSNRYFYPSNLVTINNSLIFCASNESGGTSLLSLNLNDYSAKELEELIDNPNEPFIFQYYRNPCAIIKLSDEKLFLSTLNGSDAKIGWIYNVPDNTINQISEFDNVTIVIENISVPDDIRLATVYNDELYYSKDKQVWKYSDISNSLDNLDIEESAFSMYPNPAHNYINFKNSENIQNVEIIDISGKTLINKQKINNNQIDISSLDYGVYIIRIKFHNNTLITSKIIKR